MNAEEAEYGVTRELQTWFQSCRDGVWEHSFVIKIETTDNPGWVVTIDLIETELVASPHIICNYQIAEDNWMMCQVNDKSQFIGGGDSQKLIAILAEFARFRKVLEAQ